MEEAPKEPHAPAMRIGDAERDATIRLLERAMAAGHLTFDEMEHRMAIVYRTKTKPELVAVTADLPISPTPVAPPPLRLGSTQFSLIGDIKQGGWIAVPSAVRAISVVGDVTIDLSSADIPVDGVTLSLTSLIGDVIVVVADGTPVDISTISVIGDRREALTAPIGSMPPVSIRGLVVIGDIKVYSLSLVPEGRLRAWWASVRKRALGQGNG